MKIRKANNFTKYLFLAAVTLVAALFTTSCSKDNDDKSEQMTEYTVDTKVEVFSAEAGTQLASKLQSYFAKGFGTENVSLSVTYNATKNTLDFILKAKGTGETNVDNRLRDLNKDATELDDYIDGIDGVEVCEMNFSKGYQLFYYEYETRCYEPFGMWRYEVDGVKYSLYVRKPDFGSATAYSADFFYNDKQLNGTAKTKNSIISFETGSDAAEKVKIDGYFSGKESKKFTGNLIINDKTVATGVTFSRREDFNNIHFDIKFSVVDPDNELAAMGANITDLTKEVEKANNSCDTHNQRTDTAFGFFTALQFAAGVNVQNIMKEQCKKYPALYNSNVYVEAYNTELLDDITIVLTPVKYNYKEITK